MSDLLSVRLGGGFIVTALALYPCMKCGEVHLTASRRWHDEASRAVDVERMARLNGMAFAEVDRRLRMLDEVFEPKPRTTADEVEETPDISGNTPDETLDTEELSEVFAECGHRTVRPKRGPMPKWCSEGCRKKASRSKSG